MSVEVGVEEFIVDVSVVDAAVEVSVVQAIVEVNVSGTPGPPGKDSTVPGPPGANSTVPGPPGPSAVSADAGNTAVLGTDLLIFVPTPPPSGMDQDTADGRYLMINTGGTVYGGVNVMGTLYGTYLTSASLTGLAPPATEDSATNREYVDSRIWKGTQAAYDAIVTKDPAILYVVTG